MDTTNLGVFHVTLYIFTVILLVSMSSSTKPFDDARKKIIIMT